MRSVWSGKNKKNILTGLLCLILAFVPGCDDFPQLPGEGFFSYTGYRDWWRIPLVFPYQITILDSFDRGYLEKYDPSSLVADPRKETLLSGITAFARSENHWFFKREKDFCVFRIAAGKTEYFKSEADLLEFCRQRALPFPVWQKLKKLYQERWNRIYRLARDPEQGFFNRRHGGCGRRIPLKMPWQAVLTAGGCCIGKYDPERFSSRHVSLAEWEKVVKNVAEIGFERRFVLFRQASGTKTYGVLIFSSGNTHFFTGLPELRKFVGRNFPDAACPAMTTPEKLYDRVWDAVDRLKRSSPRALPVD